MINLVDYREIGRDIRKGTGFPSKSSWLMSLLPPLSRYRHVGTNQPLDCSFLRNEMDKTLWPIVRLAQATQYRSAFLFSERMRSYFATYCPSTTSYCALVKNKNETLHKSSHCHLPAPLTSLRALFNHSHALITSLWIPLSFPLLFPWLTISHPSNLSFNSTKVTVLSK